MKEQIERLRALAADVQSAANPLALAGAMAEGFAAVADALAEFEPCHDCGSEQGGALGGSQAGA